jgi:hypothetical protein
MKDLKKYLPDTPEEWSFLGSSINRLGTALSVVGIIQEEFNWALVTVGLTWVGHEISEYFKLYTGKSKK